MAVLPSPLSSSIQGINESTVSGSVFGGNRPDPETKSTLQSLSSSIVSLQRQVDDLNKNNITNIGVFANFQQSFANQIENVRLQLNKVDDTLESVATIIANESTIERQKDLYEEEKEKRLAEAGARGGKESLLETKIQNALRGHNARKEYDKLYDNVLSVSSTAVAGGTPEQPKRGPGRPQGSFGKKRRDEIEQQKKEEAMKKALSKSKA